MQTLRDVIGRTGGSRGRGVSPSRWNEILPPVALLAALIVVWELAVTWFEIPAIILPKPSEIASALINGMSRGTLPPDVATTLVEIVLGFFIGVAVGGLLGVAVAEVPIVERLVYPYVVALHSIPVLAIAPIIVIWLGLGLASKIAVVVLITFFPLTVNTVQGLRAVSASQVEMLRSFGASRGQVMRMARLPSALPYIFAGLDVAAINAVIGAVVAEWLGATGGLGSRILRLTFQLDVAGMFAVLVILALLGMLAHRLVRAIERRVVFWHQA